MLLNIALGVLTCLLVSTGFHLLNNGKVFNYTDGDDGFKHRKLAFLTKTGATGWIIALVAGAALAFINYFSTKITRQTLWLAWVFLVVIVIGYVMLAVWWKMEEGCEVSEGFCFFLISMTPFLTMKTLVGEVTAPWKNVTLVRIFCTLPILLVLAELVFIIISAIQIRNTEGGQKFKWLTSGAALMLATLFVIAGLTGCGASDAKAVEKAYEDQAVEQLTVHKLTPEDLEKLTLEKYKDIPETLLDSSLSPHDKSRTAETGFSDALTYGFSNKKDANKMFRELEEEILRNPVYGVTVVKALRGKKIGDQAIGDFNSWMDEMVQKNGKGVFVWCEYRDNSNTIYVTEEYRCYAATICTLLERLVEQGVQSHQTIENWCLNSAAKNNDRAGVKASYQYKKEAFILAYVGKNEAGDKNPKGLLVIGFNIHDKRPEFFGEEDKPKVVNVPPSGGGSTPNPGGGDTPDNPTPTPTNPDNPTSPTTPSPTTPSPTTPSPTTPSPTTPEPTVKPKDPNLAPSENAEPNDDSGPGPDTNNGVGATESTRDNPNNSNHYPSYGDYVEDMTEMQDTNQNQRTGNDDNTPSHNGGNAAVDNNGDNGTGNGGINTPTPVQDPAQTHDGHSVADDEPGGAWGGPPD